MANLTNKEVEELLASEDFPEMKNERILLAAKGIQPDKLPIWIMRQAGRYLPEFQALRKKHSFFEICQTPKLACEATLMPIKRYDLDAAIIFSDILVIPQALGMEVVMEPEKGPVFPKPLTPESLKDLDWSHAIERLGYVGNAIRLTRHKLEGKVPLIGFSAAPWTLMCYMIEGGGTKTASKAKKWFYSQKKAAFDLIHSLTIVIVDYLVMQVEHGVQMIQIFESSAEYLSKDLYEQWMPNTWSEIREMVNTKLKAKNISPVPMVLFAKGGGHLIDLQVKARYEVISIDWVTEPASIREKVPTVTLQGNLDPCALYSSKEDLQKMVHKMCKEFGFSRYIVNLGHGIYPDATPDAVKWFVDAVHEITPNSLL